MIGGCLRRIIGLAVLVAIVAFGWQYRAQLRAAWIAFRSADPVVAAGDHPAGTPQGVEAKLLALENGEVERIALAQLELQGLIDSWSERILPPYVVGPKVEIRGGRIRLRFQVPTDRFPRADDIGEVLGFLPDTTDVTASGQLIPLRSHRVGVAIDEVTAARIPLPRGMIPAILHRLGRRDEPGLPPDAFGLDLPDGVTNAYIRGDSLIFMGNLSS